MQKGNKKSNIEVYHEEAKFNKIAFDDVIGDPFAFRNGTPEPVTGNYLRLQQRSSIQVMKHEFDMGKATRNTAQPNIQDFFCDVERIVEDGFNDAELLQKFTETYILESEDRHFTSKQRMELEQKIGKLFRTHKISPVSKYFTSLRKGRPNSERKHNDSNNGSNSTSGIELARR